MTGLEKIIAQIKSDAEAAAQEIESQAKADVKAIADETNTAAAVKVSQLRAQTKTQVANAMSAAESAAALSKRRAILAAKQEVIAKLIDEAKQDVYSLPDDEYFVFILKMIKKYSTGQDGTILFSKKDLARLPAGFQANIDGAAKGKLVLDMENTRELDSGFVLLYNSVEENCSISALFDAEVEQLQDTVSKFLFA